MAGANGHSHGGSNGANGTARVAVGLPPGAHDSPLNSGNALAGVRVAVVGTGEPLARALNQLHRAGALCHALDDPYRGVAELARRSGGYGFVVLVLPCIYQEELAIIRTVHRLFPAARVLVAAADQHVSLLTAAMRLGIAGVLTESGVELFDAPVADQTSTPHIAPAPGGAHAEEPAADSEPIAPPASSPADTADLETDPFVPGDPLLSAEELEALLQDEDDAIRSTDAGRSR